MSDRFANSNGVESHSPGLLQPELPWEIKVIENNSEGVVAEIEKGSVTFSIFTTIRLAPQIGS